VREAFQQSRDLHVFGHTVDEQDRIDRFIDAYNDVCIWPILAGKGLTHDDCLAIVDRAFDR
jgi:hypothetical protein